MASTSTSNSHSTSTLALASPPSTTILSATTTTTTSCSSSASHCTPEGNDSSPIALLSMAAETPLEHCSPSTTSEPRNNDMETDETQVEVGKNRQEDESTSPRPLTDSSKDKADNSSIKTRKKRKKNNSSCRIIRAGEDVDDSCTFSSSSSASDNEKAVSAGKKRFFRKRENHRKTSPGHLSPFDFEDDMSSEQDSNNQKNRKSEQTRTSSERRFSRRKSTFFNKFPDLIWGSSNNKSNKEKMGHGNLPNVNLVEDDDIVESHAELIRPMKKDSLKKQVELKKDRRQFIDEQLRGESNETTLSPSEMFSTHYNLRWKNHQSHMLLAFESLLYNESFVDVSLVCSCDDDDYEEEDAKRIKELNKLDHDEANDDDGKVREQVNANRNNEEGDGGGGQRTHKNETVVTIKAHKIVLSASSEFFQRIFAENPCKHPVVILTSFQRWEVQALVDFMYRGEVDVSSERLSSIIKTAASLQIRGLADYAGKFDTINKHEESIEPHSPLPHQHNLNMSSAPKLPPQIIMNRKTMEGLRRGLDRELLREHRSNSSMDVDNEGEEDHLEMMRIRRQQRSLSPKLLNLSMGSNSGHTHAHLSSKTESVSSSSRNKSNFQREEPQATLGQSRDPEPFPHTNHHHRQKQLRQPDHQEILNNNNGNSSSNDFIHHYGTGNLGGTNHHLNTSPMFIPRRKQARPRRRSGDFVAVAQDLRKGNVQPEQLQNQDQSPPQQNQTSRSSSRTPTSTPSSSTQQNQSISTPNSNQNHNQVQQNMNSHQHLNSDHLTNHIRQQAQSLNHSQQQFSHHRRSSRHHRRSNHSQHVRPLAVPHDDLEDHEADEMDENQVLDYTTSAGATFNNNSLIAAGLNHPHPLAMKHWMTSTPTPPLNQRNSPVKGDGDSDDGLTPPPEQCHTPPISPTDPKGYPVDFPLFGMGDHPHLHNNRNLPLTAFKTSPPSPSSFFLSGFSNANGPLSMSILAHSDESNNAGESASTPPNVFSPAGFPMPMALPLTNSNSNNTNSNNHGGTPGLNSSQGQRSSPVGWPGLPLGPAPIFGRHRAQHSAPRGGPPRAWSNADLTEALHNVWNKKMTTSQASRIFGIPYNSLLMYVRGKYGKSLKLDLLKKGLDMALENKANSNNSSASSAKESNNASSGNHNHSTVNINNNNNNPSSGKGGRVSNNSNNSSPSSQNINNNNISKSKSHHNAHHHHHHPQHHHHSQHSHHHHHHGSAGAGGSPPLGIGNIGLVGLGEPPDIPAGFNPFTAAASIFGDYPAPFPFASALSHILPPGSLITADKVALNDDDK